MQATDFTVPFSTVEVPVDWEDDLLEQVQAELDARSGRIELPWLDSSGQVVGLKVIRGNRVAFYNAEHELVARFGAA
jgi:hypothetical protein